MGFVAHRTNFDTRSSAAEFRERRRAGERGDFSDDKGVKTELPVEAPYIVESSPGNFQPVYIFEHPLAPADAKPALTALCDFVGGDSGTKDCSHLWRIPGTLNIPTKSKLARGRSSVPAPVSIKKPYEGRFISPAALLALALPPRLPNGHDTAPSGQRSFAEEARLRSALAVISAENRDIWLKVGAALHVLGARAVWGDWSKTSGKFDAADQDRVWASFHGERNEGVVTIATIYAWAKQRGWVPSVNAEEPRQDRERRPAVPVKIYTYDEMVNLPAPDFAVHGLIVCRAKNVMLGPSNVFKSFITTDLGGSVSTGITYHGMATKKMKVFYVANEGAHGVGRKRIAAWMAYHGIPLEARRNIFLIKAETILPNEISRNNLLAAIRLLVEPGEDFFIIFDVLRGTMTGSESDDEAARAWTAAAENLIAEGATLLTVTHSPYSEDARMRGHSHLWGSFDARLQVEGDKEKRTAVLKIDRIKDHESTGQWGFTLEEQETDEHPGEFSLVPRLDGTVRQGKTKPRKLPKNADLALSALKYALDQVGAIPAGKQSHSGERQMRHGSAMARILLHAIRGGQAGHQTKGICPGVRLPIGR